MGIHCMQLLTVLLILYLGLVFPTWLFLFFFSAMKQGIVLAWSTWDSNEVWPTCLNVE